MCVCVCIYIFYKMQVAKLAQMGNFCLAKSDVRWPMAQMATGSASLDIYIYIFYIYTYFIYIYLG